MRKDGGFLHGGDLCRGHHNVAVVVVGIEGSSGYLEGERATSCQRRKATVKITGEGMAR